MKIIDLTFTLDENCLTCGTPWHVKPKISHLGTIKEVGRNTHSIFLGSHTATHIDAPLHFFDGAPGIDQLDLSKVCGNCTIVNYTDKLKGSVVSLDDVRALSISKRMLFRFDWFKNWRGGEYYKDFPYFSIEAASYLVEQGMRVIALDTPSPDDGNAIGLKEDSPVHKMFLQNDVTIIEYLNNTDALQGGKFYQLIALPLKIKDCDGAPARVIAMEE